jgi:hypothetical protein
VVRETFGFTYLKIFGIAEGVQKVEKKAPENERTCLVLRKKIKVKEFVADIRAGMDDPTLMSKYDLSGKQLENVFQKLVQVDFITIVELWERSRLSESGITKAFLEAQQAVDELD